MLVWRPSHNCSVYTHGCEVLPLIYWAAVRTIAVTLASRPGRVPTGDFDYAAAVEQTVGPLSEFTGIELPQDLSEARQLRVADRAEWIDFNIEGFGTLMEPVLKRAAAGAGDLTWALGGITLTAQRSEERRVGKECRSRW